MSALLVSASSRGDTPLLSADTITGVPCSSVSLTRWGGRREGGAPPGGPGWGRGGAGTRGGPEPGGGRRPARGTGRRKRNPDETRAGHEDALARRRLERVVGRESLPAGAYRR